MSKPSVARRPAAPKRPSSKIQPGYLMTQELARQVNVVATAAQEVRAKLRALIDERARLEGDLDGLLRTLDHGRSPWMVGGLLDRQHRLDEFTSRRAVLRTLEAHLLMDCGHLKETGDRLERALCLLPTYRCPLSGMDGGNYLTPRLVLP